MQIIITILPRVTLGAFYHQILQYYTMTLQRPRIIGGILDSNLEILLRSLVRC